MGPSSSDGSGEGATAVSRRTAAKLGGAAAAGAAILLGAITDAFDVDFEREEGAATGPGEPPVSQQRIQLPRPMTAEGTIRVEEAIANRRSRREYSAEPITRAEIGQLLWAAQGITERQVGRVDLRAAPSAGATYPLSLFVVSDTPGVTGIDPGVFHYRPGTHELDRIRHGLFGTRMQEIAIDQEWVGAAALNIVITAVDERTTQRYGERGRRRYVPMEAGHAGENIYLQAESLGLSTVAIGAFLDDGLRSLLDVDRRHRPLYIYPVGRPA
jgi:SagB-type dehydrogenase family enzyme